MNLAPACAAYSGTAALGAVVHKSSAHCRVRFPSRLRPSPVKKEGTKARQGKRGGERTAAAKKDDAIFMDQPRHRHEKSLEGERRKREREEAGRRYTDKIAAIIIIKKKKREKQPLVRPSVSVYQSRSPPTSIIILIGTTGMKMMTIVAVKTIKRNDESAARWRAINISRGAWFGFALSRATGAWQLWLAAACASVQVLAVG